jgi:hypothetical protein
MDPAQAQENRGWFRDTLDNAFDISKWLFELHGLLPLFAPITEPAIGYGAVGAAVYFIPKKDTTPGQFKMPDIGGVGGGYTQNGTWFAGGGYFGFWRDNSIWYRGVFGYGDIHLKYYGSGGNFLAENPAKFNMQSYFLLQQALFRLGQSRFLLGGKYVFMTTEVTAFEESKLDWVDPKEFDMTYSGISLIGEYETLNNLLSPSRGIRVHLDYHTWLELLGSDLNLQRLTFFTLAYIPVRERLVTGLRFESLFASDNTPFYLKPFINLRGVPALRYQGQLILLGEVEQYVNVLRRWGLVAFGGYGRTITDIASSGQGLNAWNAGGGFRYLIARQLGLQMGLDVARGPEQWAIYIVFGTSWIK